MEPVVLKKGRDRSVRQRHPWIFSGAIASLPEVGSGVILPVHSHQGEWLCWAYFNKRSAIIGRIVSFGMADPLAEIEKNILKSIERRSIPETSALRLINAEGDDLPGLIVDAYDDHLVLQISTAGMECLKNLIVKTLCERLKPASIYEKSLMPSRREEGLPLVEGSIFGVTPDRILVREHGLPFFVEIAKGQKIGFFLDQRAMRQWVKAHAKGRHVLNCFSYTGGFSLFAAEGGAKRVDSVDISESAIALARDNMAHNGFLHAEYVVADVFDFLRERPLDYELIILDPPAFAKSRKDQINACRGYKEINRLAISKMPPNSLLLTSSCSHFVDEKLFQQVVFQAAYEAGRAVRIISHHLMAEDHPVSLYHPEGAYLKSLCLLSN